MVSVLLSGVKILAWSLKEYFNAAPKRLCAIACVVFLVLSVSIADALFPMPLPNQANDFARVVTDRHGVPLRVFADERGVWRYPVSSHQVAQEYLDALIQYEDRWFYWHPGVNPFAVLRASAQAIYHQKFVSGASTITMQVARILEPHSKTFFGKLRQVFRALQLEWHLSKNDILELYLNYAPFGGPIEGVQAASFTYFEKSASELSDAEAALLAVLPQSPSRLRPDRYPERAKAARNKVLDRLERFSLWSRERIQQAKNERVQSVYNSQPKIAPLLARRLMREHSKQRLIHSSIDRFMQSDLEELLKSHIAGAAKGSSAAILLVDNKTMQVRAYVGSADFNDSSRFGHVDMIQAQRSPGSTLKPFLYGLALDAGLVHEKSLMLDIPSEFNGYEPGNFDGGFSGAVSMSDALRRSLNIPAVQLLDAYGVNNFYARLRSAGLALNIPNNTPNLAMILGGAGVDLESLVAVFSSIGRKGLTRPLQFQMDHIESQVDRRLMSAEAAWIIGQSLKGRPGHRYRNQRNIAQAKASISYKTGTSYGHRDAWVLASNANFTLGVWVGRPDGSAMLENNGRGHAVPLLGKVLNLFSDSEMTLSERPKTLKREIICWPLGTLKRMQDEHECMQAHHAWLIDGSAPANQLLPKNYVNLYSNYLNIALDKKGERVHAPCLMSSVKHERYVVWPAVLEPWLPLSWRRESLLPPLASECKHKENSGYELQLVGLKDNDVIAAPLSLSGLPSLELEALGGVGDYYWYIDGKHQGQAKNIHLSAVEKGAHFVSVMDESGVVESVRFRVE